MNKRRKIRWDRVALLLAIFVVIVTCLTTGTIKIVKFLTQSNEPIIEEERITIENENNDESLAFFSEDINEEIQEENSEENNLQYLGEFKLTGYCACEECCGSWSDGYTATMTVATEGRTVAVDPDVIPLGTHLLINGVEYIAEDTGSAIIGNKIDVFVAEHDHCCDEWCNCVAEVYEIKPGV